MVRTGECSKTERSRGSCSELPECGDSDREDGEEDVWHAYFHPSGIKYRSWDLMLQL